MINRTVHSALEVLQAAGFRLPLFQMDPTQWQEAGIEWNSARQARLGWDMTDFSLGNFSMVGRVLFTLRNGTSQFGGKAHTRKKSFSDGMDSVPPLIFTK